MYINIEIHGQNTIAKPRLRSAYNMAVYFAGPRTRNTDSGQFLAELESISSFLFLLAAIIHKGKTR